MPPIALELVHKPFDELVWEVREEVDSLAALGSLGCFETSFSFFLSSRKKKVMATLVLPNGAGAFARVGPKEDISRDEKKEASRERQQAIAQEEREKQKAERDTKKRLRVLAVQRAKTDEEASKSLEEINQMSPDQAESKFGWTSQANDGCALGFNSEGSRMYHCEIQSRHRLTECLGG